MVEEEAVLCTEHEWDGKLYSRFKHILLFRDLMANLGIIILMKLNGRLRVILVKFMT